MDEQISDCDPEKGLRLDLAMGWYGNQVIAQTYPNRKIVATIEESARYSSRHKLQPGHPFFIDPSQLPELRRREALRKNILVNDIAAQLRSGKLYAIGLRVGEYTSVRIPREWWGVATLDPDMNTAEGNGVTFSGLLIFEFALEKAGEPIPSSDLDRAGVWMREHVTSYVANQRDVVVKQCRLALGVRKDVALSGWDALPQSIKGIPRTTKG